METVPGIARELADQLDVRILGSYDPRVIGCGQTEFFDFMHAQYSCLDRIFQSLALQ